VIAHGLGSAARLNIKPTEGVLSVMRGSLKQAVTLSSLARRKVQAGFCRKMKRAWILAKAGEELLRKRRRATEDVRGHAVLVWLPQPKGAGGLQLAAVLAKCRAPHAGPDGRGLKLSRLKTVASGSGIGSANCSTRHRKPMTNEDAASRRKRDDGGPHRLKMPSWRRNRSSPAGK